MTGTAPIHTGPSGRGAFRPPAPVDATDGASRSAGNRRGPG